MMPKPTRLTFTKLLSDYSLSAKHGLKSQIGTTKPDLQE